MKDEQNPESRVSSSSFKTATPTDKLPTLLAFRSIHPIYGAFLLDHLGRADPVERLQAFESVLGLPRPVLKFVRPPWPDELPPGPLAMGYLDNELIQRGLIAAPLPPEETDDDEEDDDRFAERPPSLAEKLFLLYEALYPDAIDLEVQGVWAANPLLRDYAGNFNNFIKSRDLTKQEGLIFRHLLRLVLLCGEFATLTPPGADPDEWQSFLRDTMTRLTDSCRAIDPASTDSAVEHAHDAGLVEGESAVPESGPEPA